jgi:bacteriochlorophyll 4-vinyl reductase
MSGSGVGRVLVASLHQAIGDILPMRLTFYEEWLSAEGLRDGTIGLASLYAVLSFLRQEETDAYSLVTTKAGEYAAEWTVQSMRPFARTMIARLPRSLRRRVLLDRAQVLVRMSYDGSKASWRLRRGMARVTVKTSVFCSVRERSAHPLCGYYAAAYARLLSLFDMPVRVSLESCKAAGGSLCVLSVPFNVAADEREAEVA